MLHKQIISGNEALALGALVGGASVITGYPGTPSSEAIGYLLRNPLPGVHVEWSTNEKVALEIAAGAAWAGQRALATMKMSGLNVAYDSLISFAYSGCTGGLVVYVADDPGVTAGMAEQDSRGFALMADLPMLEPATVEEAYRLIPKAFQLSEKAGTPVFVRMVTALSHSHAAVEVQTEFTPLRREPQLIRDIAKYTKAGAAICLAQHRDLIQRLSKAEEVIREMGINQLLIAPKRGLGVIVCGLTASYLEEAMVALQPFNLDRSGISVLKLVSTHPFPEQEVKTLFDHCDQILVLEELEPYIETALIVAARRYKFPGLIRGKLDGNLSRVGEYGTREVVKGLAQALNIPLSDSLFSGLAADSMAAPRPITVCAGCPHRGTYIAINQAIRKLKLKKDAVMVTGDIGCTILGMNPPFNTVWNEVSMGASLGLAQGYVWSGVTTPVIATIGDSTFFHAGIPSLINAVQHQASLTLIILDNGWTAMTGMQVNPGTAIGAQSGGHRLDLAQIIPTLGVDWFFQVDPYDLKATTEALIDALPRAGVKVILARRECAIQSLRRTGRAGRVRQQAENCNLCKLCITTTGCPAISLTENSIVIDQALCNGCALCAQICAREAIVRQEG
ncbi:MAG: thiamine pyrophosphate-dependent enzyme [bacterium]